jgi:5-methylcytosine-specific restriction endonuclease McrA
MSSRSAIKNKLDKIISKIVRSKGYCVWCGSKRTEILQCAHIYSRNNLSVRWDLENLVCLCAGCHFKAHQQPIEFTEWVKTFLGQDKYDRLRIRANTLYQWKIYELEALYESLRKLNV